MKRSRQRLFPASAPGCAMTDLRVVVISAGAIVLSAVSGWLIGRSMLSAENYIVRYCSRLRWRDFCAARWGLAERSTIYAIDLRCLTTLRISCRVRHQSYKPHPLENAFPAEQKAGARPGDIMR